MRARKVGASVLLLSAIVPLSLVHSVSAPPAAALSVAERRIVAAADAETPRAIELLERLVNINSGTLNPEGVKQVAEVMRAQLEPLGFKVSWVPMTEVGRAGHLIAEHAGRGNGKRIC